MHLSSLFRNVGYSVISVVSSLVFIEPGSSLAAENLSVERGKPFTEESLESALVTEDALYIGGGDEHLFVSLDNGRTWKTTELKKVDGGISGLLMTSDGVLLAGVNSWDEHFISASTDQGATWKRVWKDDDIQVNVILELQPGTAIGIGDEEQIVRSVEETRYGKWKEPVRPWQKTAVPFAEVDVNALHIFSNGDILLVGESGFSICYDKSFSNMQYVAKVFRESINYTSVGFVNDNEGCAGCDDGTVYRTSDRGKTWTPVYYGKTSVNGVAFNGAGTGVAVGDNGLLLISQDGGATWQPSESGVDGELAFVGKLNDGRFMAGGDSGIVLYLRQLP